jgi:hypothetical protein
MIYKITKRQFNYLASQFTREELKYTTIYRAIVDYINKIYRMDGRITGLTIVDIEYGQSYKEMQ